MNNSDYSQNEVDFRNTHSQINTEDTDGMLVGGWNIDDPNNPNRQICNQDMIVENTPFKNICLGIAIANTVLSVYKIIKVLFAVAIVLRSPDMLAEAGALDVISNLEIFGIDGTSAMTLYIVPQVISILWALVKIIICWIPYLRKKKKPCTKEDAIFCGVWIGLNFLCC